MGWVTCLREAKKPACREKGCIVPRAAGAPPRGRGRTDTENGLVGARSLGNFLTLACRCCIVSFSFAALNLVGSFYGTFYYGSFYAAIW